MISFIWFIITGVVRVISIIAITLTLLIFSSHYAPLAPKFLRETSTHMINAHSGEISRTISTIAHKYSVEPIRQISELMRQAQIKFSEDAQISSESRGQKPFNKDKRRKLA